MPTATYLVQTYNGHAWETDAELHDAQLAARHRKSLQLALDFPESETRVLAFEGGDWHGARLAYESLQEAGKPFGRKAMAKLKEAHGLTACGLL